MLTLDKFEEASEKVKEVTLETKLIYSNYLSEQTGNKVYLKPENMQFTGAYMRRGKKDGSRHRQETMPRVLPMQQNAMAVKQPSLCQPQHH